MRVVKGFEVSSGREFVEVLECVWKYILGPDKVLQFSDTVCISTDNKLYSAKIDIVEIGRFQISNSKTVKYSTFRNLFFN